MDDNNKLLKQAKPQEFELIELLFQEYIRSNIARPDIEYSFQARFQSFINQIPSYLHSSNKVGFFTHFFFGSFATLLDTKLGNKIGINKLHYNFDQANILRVVAETDGKTHVFIFAENSSKNNKQQNKNKDLEFTKGEWKTLKGREYTDADKNDLEISVVKINKSTGDIKVIVEKQNIKDDVDSTKQYHSVARKCLDNTGRYIYLEEQVLQLSGGEEVKQSEDTLRFILEYIKQIHDHYQELPYGDGTLEADQHGFVAGIFNNFRYRENAHVYLEQFAGRGYADIVLLVRGAERSTKSIPIIIELKAGFGSGTTSSEALAQVTEYSKGFQPNNMRILTIPDNILCVGMNLDHDANSFMQMKLVQRQIKVMPVIQSIIARIMESDLTNQNQIKDLLESTYQTFPGVGEKSSAHYFSRFLLGESIVLQDYDKHIFIYDDKYIETKIIIDQHATRSRGDSTAKQQKMEKIVDSSNAVTSMLFIPIRNSKDPAIIVNIIDANRDVILKNIPLDNAPIGNRKIVELNIKFNIHNSNKSFQEYCDIELLQIYNSVLEYNQIKGSEKVKGNFKVVEAEVAENMIDNISDAIDSQRDLIIAESKYQELFKKLEEILYPLKSLVNNEAEFQGILEGVFKYYSDIKLNERSDRRELVLTEFQTGGGGRIDMLIQAIGASEQGTKEYMPVGFELKYDDSVKLSSFDQQQDEYIQRLILGHKEKVLVNKLLNEQAERYLQGAAIKAITDSNKVAIMGIVFNARAKDAGDLLLTTDKFLTANIVHSSKLYSVSSNVNAINAQDSLKSDAEYFRPDWVEQETYDVLAKARGDDDSILYLSNSALNDQIVKRLGDLLKSEVQVGQYIDGLDLSFNTVTASSVQELIKQFSKLVYLDLSDNDLGKTHLIDLEEIIKDIQVPILKIADIGMNDEQMQRVFKSLKEQDKISDLEITHLDDTQIIMSDSTASVIAQYLRSTKNLNHLNLANNKIQDTAISLIVQGLVGQATVSSLVLTNNNIGVEGAKKIAAVLKETVISHIDLSGNPLGVSGVAAIVKGISGADNVKSIELVNVDFKYDRENRQESEELLSSIESLFQNPHLTKVNIAYNDIGNGGLAKIFEILSKRLEKSQLQDLSLAGNKIDWGVHPINIETLKALIYDFLSNSEKIRSLDLSLMEIDDDIGERIASALEKNVSLVHLDLGGNDGIGSKTVNSLANVFKTHQYLKYVNLSDNKLAITDLEMILGSLKTNEVVSHINLSSNDFAGIITDTNGQEITDLNNQYVDFEKLLSGNRELKYLNLANCKLNRQSILSLCKAIENNIAIEVLDIRNNEIESSIVDSIIGSLNKNANQGLDIGLKILHISKGDLEGSTISKLTDKSLGIAVLVDGIDVLHTSAEERLKQTSYAIDSLDKQSIGELDRDQQTFESNTKSGQYNYWLQGHDISDIARIHYGYGEARPIEIVGSIGQLSRQIDQYRTNNNHAKPLTMILNIGADGVGGDHWVSLVLHNRGNEYHGYYVDSLGNSIAGNVASILSHHRIMIHDLRAQQQSDGHNCGLWALENGRRISELLVANGEIGNTDVNSISNSLARSRSEQEFEEIRDNIFRELLNDNQRREHLYNIGINQVVMPMDDMASFQDIVIVQTCLGGTSRGKRAIAKECKIGWDDVDAISQENTRNVDEIVIDSKQFLVYSKKNIEDEQKRWQLVRLAQEIQNKGDEKIVGEYQALFDKVIEAGGYKNYIQQERMNYLGVHIINRDSDNISPKLKLKLLNAVGKVQLIHGIYGTIASCQDGSTSNCVLSISSIGYSFLSQPIEKMMVKAAPMIVKNIADIGSKIVPRILSYDTKFVVQVFGGKYGIKLAKGGAGAVASIFDIADIGISAHALIECNKRLDSNNPCSAKEIRDNIAAISFAGVSFVSGIALTAMESGPAGVVVGLVIMVGQGIYSGISNIIEYEEKYDTTHAENWSIFWRTFLIQKMSEDIEQLEARHVTVHEIVENAEQILSNSPEFIVAYATGLGKEELTSFSKCRQRTYGATVPATAAVGAPYCTTYKKYNIQTTYSKIDMSNSAANTNKLSRVLPKDITNTTMICLPKITDADYEKGLAQSRSDAIYECDNAVVISYNDRRADLSIKDQYIVYDLRYVSAGTIIGGYELNNMFQIFSGSAKIFGSSNLNNIFYILDSKYNGKIYLDHNSTNIIDVSNLLNEMISMEYTHIYPLTMNISITANKGAVSQVYSKIKDVEIRYIGRKYKVDKIICKPLLHQRDGHIVNDNEIKHNNITIDSGGGVDYKRPDEIENCNYMFLSPNTIAQGDRNNHVIYIKSLDYAKNYTEKYALSRLAIGGGLIIFNEISLLKDCMEIKYNNHSLPKNSLNITIPLGNNAKYELILNNYLNKDKQPNYLFRDKYSNEISLVLNHDAPVKKFILSLECKFSLIREVVEYYRNISLYHREDYEVFSTVNNTQYNNFYKFGSSTTDIIFLNKDVVYAEGNNGHDLYIVTDYFDYTIHVNNEAKDLQLDILKLPVNNVGDIFLIKNTNNLHLLFNNMLKTSDNRSQEVIIDNYFQDKIYQHVAIALMDTNIHNIFIPFNNGNIITLLPFYHASLEQNIFVLSSNSKAAVIDINQDNIVFYKQNNDLLLTEKQVHGFNSLSIILQDYYIKQHQWLDVKPYGYNNNAAINIIDLNNIKVSAINYEKEYNSTIKEYVVDFTARSHEIEHHKQIFNDQLVKEDNQERIGVVILQDTSFDSLGVVDHDNDLILSGPYNGTLTIRNWYKDDQYKISMFEFDTGIEQERVYVSHQFANKIKLNNRLSHEILKIDHKIISAVISYVIFSCGQYDGLAKSLTSNFLEDEKNRLNSHNLSVEELIKGSHNDTSGKVLLLLAAKAHNKLLLKYNIEKEDILQNSCFNTILSSSIIKEMIECINTSINFSRVEQFINNNKNAVHKIMKTLATAYIGLDHHHKHRHHHGDGIGHHKGRRDIEDKLEIAKDFQDNVEVSVGNVEKISSSSASNGLKPIGYNIVSWIQGVVSKLTGINPIKQVQKNVGFNVDDAQEKTTLNDVDAMHNELYRGNDLEYLCALTNNVVDNSKLLEKGYKVEQLLDRCVNNSSTTIIKEVNYDLLDKQGNLLLLDVLMRKKSGVKYKHQQEQNIVSSNNLDSEYAQSMAYRGYVAKDKLSSVSNNNMTYMVEDIEDIEDIGLVGVN